MFKFTNLSRIARSLISKLDAAYGYVIHKNDNTVTVNNSGTITGPQG